MPTAYELLVITDNRTIGRSALTLTIIAVVVGHDVRLGGVNGVGDGVAETMALKRHDGDCSLGLRDICICSQGSQVEGPFGGLIGGCLRSLEFALIPI